jgi:hypothetical protein
LKLSVAAEQAVIKGMAAVAVAARIQKLSTSRSLLELLFRTRWEAEVPVETVSPGQQVEIHIFVTVRRIAHRLVVRPLSLAQKAEQAASPVAEQAVLRRAESAAQNSAVETEPVIRVGTFMPAAAEALLVDLARG